MILSLASALVFILTWAYFRFWASRKRTPFCHERSILYRSPQMVWALPSVALVSYLLSYRLGVTASLPAAYPIMAVYYSFRFGAFRRTLTAIFLLICSCAVFLNHDSLLGVVLGSVCGIAVAFSIDMIWNWKLKRAGIIVPGLDPEPTI